MLRCAFKKGCHFPLATLLSRLQSSSQHPSYADSSKAIVTGIFGMGLAYIMLHLQKKYSHPSKRLKIKYKPCISRCVITDKYPRQTVAMWEGLLWRFQTMVVWPQRCRRDRATWERDAVEQSWLTSGQPESGSTGQRDKVHLFRTCSPPNSTTSLSIIPSDYEAIIMVNCSIKSKRSQFSHLPEALSPNLRTLGPKHLIHECLGTLSIQRTPVCPLTLDSSSTYPGLSSPASQLTSQPLLRLLSCAGIPLHISPVAAQSIPFLLLSGAYSYCITACMAKSIFCISLWHKSSEPVKLFMSSGPTQCLEHTS